MKLQDRTPERDRWIALLERCAPWIVGGIVAGIAVLWLLAAILGPSGPRP